MEPGSGGATSRRWIKAPIASSAGQLNARLSGARIFFYRRHVAKSDERFRWFISVLDLRPLQLRVLRSVSV